MPAYLGFDQNDTISCRLIVQLSLCRKWVLNVMLKGTFILMLHFTVITLPFGN